MTMMQSHGDHAIVKHRAGLLLPAPLPTFQQIQQHFILATQDTPEAHIGSHTFTSVDASCSQINANLETIINNNSALLISIGSVATRLARELLETKWDEINHLAIATGNLVKANMLRESGRLLLPATAALEAEHPCLLTMAQAIHSAKPTMRSVAIAVTQYCWDGAMAEEIEKLTVYFRYKKIAFFPYVATTTSEALAHLNKHIEQHTIDTIICVENSFLTEHLAAVCAAAHAQHITVCAGGPPSLAPLGPAIIYGSDMYGAMGSQAFKLMHDVTRGLRSIDSFGVIEFKRSDLLYLNMRNNNCIAQGLDHEHLMRLFGKQPKFARVLR